MSIAYCMPLSSLLKTIKIYAVSNAGDVYGKTRDSRRISDRSLLNARM